MVRINGLDSNTPSFGSGIYTKRQCIDNSEIYISSKLSKLYNRTLADCFVSKKLDKIREFADTNKEQNNGGKGFIA